MKILFAALLATGFVSSAQANWTNNFAGTGVYTNDEGDNVDFTLQVQIMDDGKILTINVLSYETVYSFNIENGKLFLNEVEVGTLADDMISIKYDVQYGPGCVATLNIGQKGEDFSFLDDYV